MDRDDLKIVTQMDNLLTQIAQSDLQTLMKNAENEPDPNKKKVLYAFYSYALAEQQDKLLKNKRFII